MAKYRVSWELKLIEPTYDSKEITFYGSDSPTLEEIKAELLIVKPSLERKKDLIRILSATKILDE